MLYFSISVAGLSITSIIREESEEMEESLQAYTLSATLLGQGAYGKIMGGVHKATGKKVALKVIARDTGTKCINREVDNLKCLSHKNICELYEIIETAENTVLVLEYCQGQNLSELIMTSEIPLADDLVQSITSQLLQALQYMHEQHVAHRDIKPSNMMINSEENVVKIIDLGLAADAQDLCTDRCGTARYVAPEILQKQPYDATKADIWSLGVSIYHMLTKQFPFEGKNKGELYSNICNSAFDIPEHISEQCTDALQKMLEKDPCKRWSAHSLLGHPWLAGHIPQSFPSHNKFHIDDKLVKRVARLTKRSKTSVLADLKEWQFNHTTATYLLLSKEAREMAEDTSISRKNSSFYRLRRRSSLFCIFGGRRPDE